MTAQPTPSRANGEGEDRTSDRGKTKTLNLTGEATQSDDRNKKKLDVVSSLGEKGIFAIIGGEAGERGGKG